jgi:hypothetical protein
VSFNGTHSLKDLAFPHFFNFKNENIIKVTQQTDNAFLFVQNLIISERFIIALLHHIFPVIFVPMGGDVEGWAL